MQLVSARIDEDDLCQTCPLAFSKVLSIATMYGSIIFSHTNRRLMTVNVKDVRQLIDVMKLYSIQKSKAVDQVPIQRGICVSR